MSQVTPLEVYQQYAKAVAQHIRPVPGTRIVKLCRYAPLEHPLVQQFQRAIDSLTAALAPASARQYRAVARYFLIYLGEQHPAVGSLNQLRRDPHILGWFVDLRSQNLGARGLHRSPAAYALHAGRACLERATPRSGPSDPSRGHSARSATAATRPDAPAGSVNPAGTAPPQ